MRGARFRGLLCSALLVASGAPAVVHANDRSELLEPDFLDLVDQAGLVLITGQGAVGWMRKHGVWPKSGPWLLVTRAFVSRHQPREIATPCFAPDA